MSFHVGIDPSWGHLSYYNVSDGSVNELKIMRVDNDETAKIYLMFEEIISKIDGKLENACICLSPSYGNEIRKKFLEEGLKFGFKNVEIINYSTAIFLNAMSQKSIKFSNGSIIWIYRYSYFNVWQIDGQKAKFMGFWEANSSKLNELENVVKQSKLNKGPDFVLYDSEIDKENVGEIADCEFFAYNDDDFAFSNGSLVKARITDGNIDFDIPKAVKFLSQKYSIKYGEKEIATFEAYLQELPIGFTYKMNRVPNFETLEIISDGNRKECMKIPNQDEIYFTFHIDANEIYTVIFDEQNSSNGTKYFTINGTNDNGGIQSKHNSDTPQNYIIPRITTSINTKIHAVGIDLGTSRCCAAVNRKNGIATVHLDSSGERLLPSYVAYDEEHVKCGKIVVNRLRQYSKSTVFDNKRIIGRNFCDIEIDSNWPFKISQNNNEVVIEIQKCNVNMEISAEEVSADLLKYIKEKAEEFQGTNLKNVVITVPAGFTETQNEATIRAARLADWEDIHLLPESIAAAFAYFADEIITVNSNVLLFDLGGGTLDVCIFEILNDNIRIISNTGDTKLGGRDFDNVLFNYFKNQLSTKHSILLNKDKKYKLILDCQRIKEDLSTVESCKLDVTDYDTTQEGVISISRENFQKMAQTLLNKVKNTINAALLNAKHNPNDIQSNLDFTSLDSTSTSILRPCFLVPSNGFSCKSTSILRPPRFYVFFSRSLERRKIEVRL